MTSKIIYSGKLRTEATHLKSNTSIQTDAPIDNNGQGGAFSPTDLVASALGSCMMTIMGIKARDKGWKLENTQIDIEKIMAASPRRIATIRVILTFPKTAPTDKAARQLLENAARNCPVAKSIHPDIHQDIQFRWSDN